MNPDEVVREVADEFIDVGVNAAKALTIELLEEFSDMLLSRLHGDDWRVKVEAAVIERLDERP